MGAELAGNLRGQVLIVGDRKLLRENIGAHEKKLGLAERPALAETGGAGLEKNSTRTHERQL